MTVVSGRGFDFGTHRINELSRQSDEILITISAIKNLDVLHRFTVLGEEHASMLASPLPRADGHILHDFFFPSLARERGAGVRVFYLVRLTIYGQQSPR